MQRDSERLLQAALNKRRLQAPLIAAAAIGGAMIIIVSIRAISCYYCYIVIIVVIIVVKVVMTVFIITITVSTSAACKRHSAGAACKRRSIKRRLQSVIVVIRIIIAMILPKY